MQVDNICGYPFKPSQEERIHSPPKLFQASFSDFDSMSYNDDEDSEGSQAAEEIIFKWFHEHGIEPGDPSSIVEAY